jgi:hypothetical protein
VHTSTVAAPVPTLSRRLVAFVVAACLAVVGLVASSTTTASAATADEVESNNSFATANALPLGTTIKGSALTDSNADYDYYQLDLPSRSRVNLKLTFPAGLPGDTYAVTVYDADGDRQYEFPLVGSDHGGTWTARYATYLPAGSAYVRIYGYKTWASWGKEYQLTVTATPGTVESPSNDSLSSADTLPLGTTIKGSSLTDSSSDYDYYHFTFASQTRVGARLVSAPGLSGDGYTITVYDTDGNQVYSTSTLASRTVNQLAWTLPAGGGYVRIYGYKGWSTWGKEYQLTVARVLKTATPTISGTAKVGRWLTAKPGTWSPTGTTLRYQWYRSGKAITGATAKTYKVRISDAGRKVAVKVTGSRAGYLTASRTSAARTIAKVGAKVVVTVPKPVSHTARGAIAVKVTTPATTRPTGTVKVTVNGKSVSKKLVSAAKGKTTITLPRITRRGSYKVTVAFKPSGSTATSTAGKTTSITIWVR